MHLLLLLVALVAVLLFISWYKRAPKANQRRLRNRPLLIAGGLILLFALLTGRLHPLFAALAAIVPLAYRAFGLFQTFNAIRAFTSRMKAGASPGPTPGQTFGHMMRVRRCNGGMGEPDLRILPPVTRFRCQGRAK